MTWALRRQIFYVGILLLFFSVFGFMIIYPSLNKAPTCSDGKQNGDETGVDCGGSCLRACLFEADSVSVLWSRSFEVVPGRYNAVAYLENYNKNFAIEKIKYSFRFADENNVYLGRRQGVAHIPPGRAFAIFERGVEFGNAVPVYTTFEFTEAPLWINVPDEILNQAKLVISETDLSGEETSPRLSATVRNLSLFTIPDIALTVILYGEDRNALSTSSTYLDELKKQESKIVNFTWPMPFGKKVIKKEILPVYNIFSVRLE
ncbi:hypothetical protein A3D42_02850 [Candidatus Nomurabacteria bacterium RIFCSPHIGHO2_02_FULL_41_18]|uniref:Glucose/sorbosone dehydrogenase n=1 Tax=Candidatus Nomurabacteria bacterium RIFCSPHIGHO2_02_FULL_41_18 TaxID=1801754 RepID=A0A1F6W879_9BACT|nr:MAG: hypothetical protein A2737_02700 [Candidatus Nomurabacteria bacterium RIFCSPHIGHO2_01_FULL_41_71]OGI78128.1 MAG: hypothetical protein A3D42_02850 [Candidatus Nomurabacteria bacterium RIFCSPHIGHO2_02_FULL_41_18]OGI90310.1 MAG: hypothetical protein A3B01_03360 [Candidatus Nomurabacteria bacterium RIFCSPLOWO2_01_FULL_41_52b]OGJ00546.1 MAG: hypothetical protein A3I90_01795 [Candidatus Nomurabacteria bacterium RIFCSPLOWO2_02_FULL_41_9]